MSTQIRTIELDKLVPHPDNPNRMSRTNFNKLVRHIERTGRYEPLVVRPQPGRPGFFQIINGHHRCAALRKLGYHAAEAVVWNVDDEQAGILLATLNRLNGRDSLDKKLALLRRLHTRLPSRTLARLLPQTYGQIERLLARHPPAQVRHPRSGTFAIPLVFFVNEGQLQTIEEALAATRPAPEASTRATKRAAALTHLARSFLDQQHAEKAACPETESEVPVGT